MTHPITTDSIAIAHKDYDVRGGGEILAEELARTFDAPLYVGRRNPDCEHANDIDVQEIETTNPLRRAIDHGGLARTIAIPLMWRQDATELYDHDIIITSGAQPRWWKPRDDQVVISYTHSTPRRRTDQWHTRNFSGVRGRVGGLVSDAFELYYSTNVRRPDLFVCNSELVARRVERYWGIPEEKIRVVYPPVDTGTYDPGLEATGDYYLGLSRLHPWKEFGDVIRAFIGTDRVLKLAGTGPDEPHLRALADGHDNIQFLGYVSETEKRRLLAGAKAYLFNARNEDFGIAPIEALASGTPVIGVREGFTRYQITHGHTGYLYHRGVTHLKDAIDTFERDGVTYSDAEIAAEAEHYSLEQFHDGMQAAIRDATERARIRPNRFEAASRRERPALADGGDHV